MKHLSLILVLIAGYFGVKAQQVQPRTLQNILEDNNLLGMQLIYTSNGKPTAYNIGVGKEGLVKKVTPNTIFRAGSLGKTVFAYAVMRLYDRGILQLDTPLLYYMETYSRFDAKDPRFAMITARMVLSHTSGLAEFAEFDEGQTHLNAAPGSTFAYSGEGYWFLQKVLEKLLNKPFEQMMQDEVFIPLEMTASTYVQNNTMDSLMLGNENRDLAAMYPNAAFSMLTNAHDYNIFLQALLNGTGLKPATQKLMLSRQTNVPPIGRDTSKANTHIQWGLGVGLQQNEKGNAIWHWGLTGDFNSFYIAYPDTKQSLVFFTRGTNALKITDELVNLFLGKQTTYAIRLVRQGYDNPAAMALLHSRIRAQGLGKVDAILIKLKAAGYTFSEKDLDGYGQVLLKQKRYAAAQALFKQRVTWYPQSAGAYESYAAAFDAAGDQPTALQNYRHSLALDTGNVNAWYHIKALENKELFTTAQLSAFTGKFVNERNAATYLTLNTNGNRLLLTQSWDGNKLEFFRVEGMEFYNQETGFKLSFEKDAAGNIAKAYVATRLAWVKVKP